VGGGRWRGRRETFPSLMQEMGTKTPIHLFLKFILFLATLEFEYWVSCLLTRCSTTSTMSPCFYFLDKASCFLSGIGSRPGSAYLLCPSQSWDYIVNHHTQLVYWDVVLLTFPLVGFKCSQLHLAIFCYQIHTNNLKGQIVLKQSWKFEVVLWFFYLSPLFSVNYFQLL
jgi:hypothetical protein